MNCQHTQQAIDRMHRLAPEERAAVHGHLAHCGECSAYFDATLGLDDELRDLGHRLAGGPAVGLSDPRLQRAGALHSQSIWALAGVLVALPAALILWLQGEHQFVTFAMGGTVLALLFSAWHSRRRARWLFAVAERDDAIARWCAELRREYRQITWGGPLLCFGFAVLVIFAMVRHGVGDWRWLPFALIAIVTTTVVGWLWRKRRPEVGRELALLRGIAGQ